MLLIVALALGAALLYGVADFMGGVAARRIPVLLATTINYAFAAAVVVVATTVTGGEWSASAVGGGVLAGVLAVIGFLTFYAALAAGPISLMTPLIALLSSVVPVIATVVDGEVLRPLAWAAIALALVASMLIGVERRIHVGGVRPRTVVLAVISGVSFGFATVALDSAPEPSALIPVLLETVVGLVLLLALVAAVRVSPAVGRLVGVLDVHASLAAPAQVDAQHTPGVASASEQDVAASMTRRARRLAALAGVLIGGANVLLMIALHAGNVAIVAVLVNLYPVATVVLAWAVLRERVSRTQAVGAALAIAASVLLGMA